MALRPLGLRPPPPVEDPALQSWLEELTQAINGLPFSYFSTSVSPNNSSVTAPIGTIGVDIGNASIARVWIKERAPASTGWSSLATN